MTDYSYEDLAAPPAAAYRAVKNVARAARNAACQLFHDYPGYAAGAPGQPNASWVQSLYNSMCGDSPTPPPNPSRRFSGGQCPTEYSVEFRWENPNFGTVGLTQIRTGPLGGISSQSENSGGSTVYGYGMYSMVDGVSTWIRASTAGSSNADLNANVQDFRVHSVTRVGGGADDCGDPPLQYDPGTYALPPDNLFDTPYVPPSGQPGDGMRITIPLAVINNFFRVNVDVGGVTVKFGIDKVSINLGNKNGDGSPSSFDGDDSSPSVPDNIATKDDTDAIRRDVEDSQKNSPDSPLNDPSKQDREDKDESDEKKEDAIARLVAVEVYLTEVPSNARTEWGGGDAPDVFYAGWFEWRSKGKTLPRQPIHFKQNRFLAPAGVDGYAYTLKAGYKGKHSVFKAKA